MPEKPMPNQASKTTEALRLEALYNLNILDTKKEECFDRITRLATRVFDVPMALVSLIDNERQWFKSAQGLDVCETSRSVSFCHHAIQQDEIYLVEDATESALFKDNPFVVDGPKIRFYAGFPLTTQSGYKIGTLCIIDDKPRVFSKQDKSLLVDLGRICEAEVHRHGMQFLDAMTGLLNEKGLQKAIERHNQQGNTRDYSLVALGLDYYTQYETKFACRDIQFNLSFFAKLLQRAVGRNGACGRVYNDLFYLLVESENLDAILASITEQIQMVAATAQVAFDFNFSYSIVSPTDDDIKTVLEKAEMAMRAKTHGKAL